MTRGASTRLAGAAFANADLPPQTPVDLRVVQLGLIGLGGYTLPDDHPLNSWANLHAFAEVRATSGDSAVLGARRRSKAAPRRLDDDVTQLFPAR